MNNDPLASQALPKELPQEDRPAMPGKPHVHKCLLCGREHYCEVQACPKPLEFVCDCQFLDPAHENKAALHAAIEETLSKSSIVLCVGHECPWCHKIWHHDYKCNRPANIETVCKPCNDQSSVNYHRPEAILEIAKNGSGSPLTKEEIAAEFLNHEAQVHLMIHDENGILLENWNDILSSHLIQLRKLFTQIKIHESASSKVKVNTQAQEWTKLTPEEKKQFERDALKDKKKNAPKIAKAKEDKQAAHDRAIEKMIESQMTAHPKWSRDKAKEFTLKMYEALEDEE